MADCGQVEPGEIGQAGRHQGLLDDPGLPHLVGQGLLAELEPHRGPDGLEQNLQVLFAAMVPDAQAEDVGRVAADEDGGRIQLTELGLHGRVPAG